MSEPLINLVEKPFLVRIFIGIPAILIIAILCLIIAVAFFFYYLPRGIGHTWNRAKYRVFSGLTMLEALKQMWHGNN